MPDCHILLNTTWIPGPPCMAHASGTCLGPAVPTCRPKCSVAQRHPALAMLCCRCCCQRMQAACNRLMEEVEALKAELAGITAVADQARCASGVGGGAV